MPTENTHIYFADRIFRNNGACHPAVRRHLKYFYLGSICPDAFYWTRSDPVKDIFLFIHQSSGAPLKDLIFDWLDLIRGNRREAELVFLFGFLTHCALDVTFHPAINAIAGNVFDENPEKRRAAGYVHAYVECHIDHRLTRGTFFKHLRLGDIKKLAGIDFISKRFGVSRGDICRAYRTQKTINRMYKSRMAYHVVAFLQQFDLCSLYPLPYFDENLKKDTRRIEDVMAYTEPVTGQRVAKTLDDLLIDAGNLATAWIACADAYYNGRVSRKQGERVIDGRNLVTGTV